MSSVDFNTHASLLPKSIAVVCALRRIPGIFRLTNRPSISPRPDDVPIHAAFHPDGRSAAMAFYVSHLSLMLRRLAAGTC
ncbi:hypothetical protein B0H17DRAFT_1212058 [Mycena rosella]|uniref:Uncharacterized protein n=1 Tax=Mycena rosella TaxID=1033263 RepID=A0AAD7CT78_MYCRO|nr:hypothetical protein B0H17DRAFT_1212058 [Mycena rosella]